jgi:rod shape-determining protein MreC
MSSIFANDSSLNRNLAVFAVLSLVLLFTDANSEWLKPPRLFLSHLKPLVEYPAYAPGQLAEWFNENLKSRQTLLQENAKLRDQALTMQRRIQRFASLTAENIRLRELLGSSTSLSDSVLVSEIIGIDADPYSHKVVLNKGSSDGVFVGMPIIDASGLMGQIVFVSEYSSRGLLITDLRHGLSVEVVRNGVRAIALGTGSLDEISLSHVANTVDIEVDDILVSSGLGERFPQGYPVGMVASIERHAGRQYAQVTVRPLAQLSRSRHVLLVFKEGAKWTSLSDEPAKGGSGND